MKTNFKNVLAIIFVAILSAGLTLFGYDYIQRKNLSTNNIKSAASPELTNTFGQNDNVRLTSMTTTDGYPDFTEAAEKSLHGVVHVKTTKTSTQQRLISPFDFFFGFGDRGQDYGFGQPRTQVGFGSGVIISKDGYIITNNHVVAGANKVSITLNDNREFEAKVVGSDPASDIALLKIDNKKDDFPYVPFGNSDDLKVGEWVLAVGNPFNLTSTVTAGIVSAKNRSNVVGNDMGIQSFIQVDAAVNPGNSGGALVNTRGELVGINTAIYSQTGNFAGYAFAIPISIAGKVASDIKEYGSVQRALMGISAPNIEALKRHDPKRASELLKIVGVYIEDFSERSPAYQAGMKKGDVIKSINGVKIRNFSELQNQITRYRPGEKINVVADRDGKEKTFVIELKNEQGNTEITKPSKNLSILGAKFKEIPDSNKQRFGIRSGIEVESVSSNGKFRKAGINKGFIIMRINNQPINSEADIQKILATTTRSEDKAILVAGFYPGGRTQYIAIDLSR